MSEMELMIWRCSVLDILSQQLLSWTPGTWSMNMYSHPIGFDASSSQSSMLGTGMDVFDLTVEIACQKTRDRNQQWDSLSLYAIVATSEFVVSRWGPAMRVGTRATMHSPLSMV
jgi:hypothetical protein